MSLEVQLLVWKHAPLNLSELQRLVLARMALFADDSGGQCYPAVSTLADELCANERSIRRCLRALEHQKLLITQLRAGDRGQNRYSIQLDVLRAARDIAKMPKRGLQGQGDSRVRGTGESEDGDRTVRKGGLQGPPIVKKDKESQSSVLPEQEKVSLKQDSLHSVELPSWLKAEDSEAFFDMRKRIKKPLTTYAWKKIVAKLEKCYDSGNDAVECLQNSIVNCWQDVYTDKAKPRKRKFIPFTSEEDIWPEFYGKEHVQ